MFRLFRITTAVAGHFYHHNNKDRMSLTNPYSEAMPCDDALCMHMLRNSRFFSREGTKNMKHDLFNEKIIVQAVGSMLNVQAVLETEFL